MTLDEYIDHQIDIGRFDMTLSEKDFISKCKSAGICGGSCSDFWEEWNTQNDFRFQRGKLRTEYGLQFEEDYKFSWKQLYHYIKDRKEEETQIRFW